MVRVRVRVRVRVWVRVGAWIWAKFSFGVGTVIEKIGFTRFVCVKARSRAFLTVAASSGDAAGGASAGGAVLAALAAAGAGAAAGAAAAVGAAAVGAAGGGAVGASLAGWAAAATLAGFAGGPRSGFAEAQLMAQPLSHSNLHTLTRPTEWHDQCGSRGECTRRNDAAHEAHVRTACCTRTTRSSRELCSATQHSEMARGMLP